jgi:uncharacterized membrane protein YkoI
MSCLDKIRLAAAIGAVIAVSAPVLLKAEDPQEKPIQGSQASIRLPNEANQEAAQAGLASITAEQAIATAKSSPQGSGGKLLRVELQNEDGFLVYNVELVSPDKKVREIKVDAGTNTILRVDVDSADRETENEERAD